MFPTRFRPNERNPARQRSIRIAVSPANVIDVIAATGSAPVEGPTTALPGSLDSDRILSTRRSTLVLALTVLVTTTTQVIVQPLAVLIEGQVEWTLALPPMLLLLILVLGCAAQAASFLLSGRWPEVTVLIATAVYIGLAVGLAVPMWLIGMYLVIALALFLLAARRPLTVSIAWLMGTVSVTVVMLLVWALTMGLTGSVAISFVAPEAIRIAAPAIAGTALGAWWRTQTHRLSLARIQAATAKREHDTRVQQAAQAERARIAQELHDVAGQHLAGLITLADASLAIAPARPEDALSLVAEIRDEGRFAAASLAAALSDLRAVSAEVRETTKDLRQANTLFEYWKRRGMSIRLATAGPVSELPAVVSTMAYRCTQEAITNAAKHAPSSNVDVNITARHDCLEVAIVNGASPSGTAAVGGLGLGWGLTGIRDRIDLLRGTLVFGATPDGGWMVRFVIPVAQPD